ncbi:helix-turn-helix domain-containing protein [Ruminococcus sp. 5_1_39BFAA]|uniref:LexA family protein n=1 Tax=Ruminococcus sp. 5_1_39BFAA TaxID=457412 RepID=UPI003568BF73
MSRVRLSDKQAEVFWFIQDCQDKKGWSPTVREIADAIGVGSTSTVYAYLKALEKKGFIERMKGSPRAIKILRNYNLMEEIMYLIAEGAGEDYEQRSGECTDNSGFKGICGCSCPAF